MTIVHLRTRLRAWLGYLIPLVQSVPSWGAYLPLMTFPVLGYFVVLIISFPGDPPLLLELLIGLVFTDLILRVLGFGLLIGTLVHGHKHSGLRTAGPYRFTRHPQYLGFTLITLGYTVGSVWILTHTFGLGFLPAHLTIGVWILEVLVYIILAHLEESQA